MSIKPQANFYNLRRAAEQLKLPFTGQILPTRLVSDFQTNKLHKASFLAREVISQHVKIRYRNDEETSFKLAEMSVQCTRIDNDKTYHTIGDVITKRKCDEIVFLAVMSKCEYGDAVLDVGDILYLQPASKFMKHKNHYLKCIAMPGDRKLSLPDSLTIELRKCEDAREASTVALCDILFSSDLPCLIRFQDSGVVCRNGNEISKGESVILEDYFSDEILLACARNGSGGRTINIYSLPITLEIDIELLHGDIPVAEFTQNEIKSMLQRFRKKANVGMEVQRIPLNNLNLKLLDYDYADARFGVDGESSDEDPYENVNNDGYEYPDVPTLMKNVVPRQCKNPMYEQAVVQEKNDDNHIPTIQNLTIQNENERIIPPKAYKYQNIIPNKKNNAVQHKNENDRQNNNARNIPPKADKYQNITLSKQKPSVRQKNDDNIPTIQNLTTQNENERIIPPKAYEYLNIIPNEQNTAVQHKSNERAIPPKAFQQQGPIDQNRNIENRISSPRQKATDQQQQKNHPRVITPPIPRQRNPSKNMSDSHKVVPQITAISHHQHINGNDISSLQNPTTQQRQENDISKVQRPNDQRRQQNDITNAVIQRKDNGISAEQTPTMTTHQNNQRDIPTTPMKRNSLNNNNNEKRSKDVHTTSTYVFSSDVEMAAFTNDDDTPYVSMHAGVVDDGNELAPTLPQKTKQYNL